MPPAVHEGSETLDADSAEVFSAHTIECEAEALLVPQGTLPQSEPLESSTSEANSHHASEHVAVAAQKEDTSEVITAPPTSAGTAQDQCDDTRSLSELEAESMPVAVPVPSPAPAHAQVQDEIELLSVPRSPAEATSHHALHLAVAATAPAPSAGTAQDHCDDISCSTQPEAESMPVAARVPSPAPMHAKAQDEDELLTVPHTSYEASGLADTISLGSNSEQVVRPAQLLLPGSDSEQLPPCRHEATNTSLRPARKTPNQSESDAQRELQAKLEARRRLMESGGGLSPRSRRAAQAAQKEDDLADRPSPMKEKLAARRMRLECGVSDSTSK